MESIHVFLVSGCAVWMVCAGASGMLRLVPFDGYHRHHHRRRLPVHRRVADHAVDTPSRRRGANKMVCKSCRESAEGAPCSFCPIFGCRASRVTTGLTIHRSVCVFPLVRLRLRLRLLLLLAAW